MSEVNSTTPNPVEYRDIPGHPGYRVGDDGSVWSLWVCVSNGQYKGTRRVIGDKWCMLKSSPDSAGYPRVAIRDVGKIRVHRLILLSFVGPCPSGMICRHLDGNPANNTRGNLAWGTHSENMLDRNRHGTQNTGERNGMHKLTEDTVRRLRDRYRQLKADRQKAPKGTCVTLANEFQIQSHHVHEITRPGSTAWKNVR